MPADREHVTVTPGTLIFTETNQPSSKTAALVVMQLFSLEFSANWPKLGHVLVKMAVLSRQNDATKVGWIEIA